MSRHKANLYTINGTLMYKWDIFYRVIHSDYGKTRQMEFKYTKDLFGPYKNDLYWSSTKGGLIKEEQQVDTNQPKV